MILVASHAFADFDTDPFYDQRVKLDAPPMDTINEHIDPFSGNMSIVQTDLHLPGNGGLDLTIMRTYNSLIYSRRDDPSNPYYFVARKDKSPLGIGWTMHMGILRYPQAPGTQWGGSPILELPDGTKQVFFKDKNDTSRLISKDFWTLKKIAVYDYYEHGDYEVRSPEGTIYSFNNYDKAGYQTTDGKAIAQVVKIQNPAGTAAINITYYKTNGYSYLSTITDSVGRVVTFTYDYANSNLLSISTDTRTISYTYQRIGSTSPVDLLKTVTPPVGNTWSYNYDSTYELNELNFPTGGKNSYTYANISFKIGDGVSCNMPYRVVTQRQTSGRGITSGIWTYAYNSGGSNITVVTGPNVTETHRFYGWGSGNISAGNVWKVGLPLSKNYNFNGASLTESFAWDTGASVSTTSINNTNWGCPGWLVADNGVFPAFLSSKSITRDGKTFTTNYSNFNSYGDPQSISESGDINRTRSITYWTNASKNIVKGKPASESVSGSFAGTATTDWSYDANSGDPTQIIKNGVTQKYTYGTDGNLSSVTDANNKTTSYLWTNGRISRETNSIYAVSRLINTNGTIARETNGRGYATDYSYDKNLRLTGITPPAGNATSFTYPADSSYRKESRGNYWIQHTFDGFVRPTGSLDSKGVTTTIAYNAYGIKDYSDSNIDDKLFYDYFGRAKQVVHKDNYSLSYAYSGSNVTITDENNDTTLFTYSAFGTPDEKYLMAVRDQATNTTTYTRNINGSVTGITQGSLNRSYTFNTKNFLTSESTPESGTITYGRDSIGTMTSKTDSSGTKNYAYDNLYRLTGITSGTGSYTYGYDNADNRVSMTSPSATIGYTYDSVNRMTQKTQTIAGKTYSTGYGYDANDNVTSQTYPSGRVISYGYNGNNQVTSINGFGGSVASVNYNTAGLPTSFITSNGITNTLSYNTRNLATSISASQALNLSFGYDGRGNAISILNLLDSSKNKSFSYDALSRLASFNGAWGSGSFGYDALGNRTTKIVAGASTSYAYSSNRLSSTSGGEAASYSYNGNGNLVGGAWQGRNYVLAYDAFDNLASFKNSGTTLADFAYDGDNQRIIKSAGGKTTVYHYDQAGHVISENDNNGILLADYVYFNGKLVAKVATVEVAPIIIVTPSSDSFGSVYVNNVTSPHVLTLKNTGTAGLVLGTATLTGANPTEFTKTADGCTGQTLAPSASCSIHITFNPTSTGAKSASIAISSNDPLSPTFNVALNGIGVLPTITVSKAGTGGGTVSSSPGGISCGSACSAMFTTGNSITLTATPDADSSFAGWTGACGGTGTCQIIMNDNKTVTAAFDILPPVAAFGASPASGGTPFIASFTDQSQRAASWSWNFGDGTTSTAQNFSHIYKTPGTYTVTLTVSNASGAAAAQKTITVASCQNQPVRILETNVYYPSLTAALGSAVDGQTIQLQYWNFLEGAIITKSVTLDGGYDCGFSTKTGRSVLEGEFRITSGSVKMKDVRIAGMLPSTFPVLSVAPPTDSFGNVLVNSASTQHTFTIGNTGGANLTIGATTLVGTNSDEFIKAADGCTGMALPPGAYCTTSVAFAPTETGPRTAVLAITSNAPAAPIVNIALNGIGVFPSITVSKSGAGSGTVTSYPVGISCGSICNGSFAPGAVTLSASPSPGSTFFGWSNGGCSGTGDCSLMLTSDTQVAAIFNQLPVGVNFSITPQTGGDPLLVTFTNLSQWATSWQWDFGDGTGNAELNPTHVYRTPGAYTITLTAANANGVSNYQKVIMVSTCQNQPVRIKETNVYYSSLAAALNAVTDNQTIQLHDRTFVEGGSIGKTILMDGGFDCDYVNKIGRTKLEGEYHITAGAVTMKDILITK